MVVLFPDNLVKIYLSVQDSVLCGTDNYGQANWCLSLQDTVYGDFQSDTPRETMETFGDTVQNSYTLILDPDIYIDPNSIFQIDDGDNYYEIIGEPEINTHLIPHQEIKLVRERK